MSKPARKQQGKEIPQKKTVAATPVVKQDTKGMTADVSRQFEIKYADLWLIAAVLIVYIPAFSLGFTELDDSIFIREFREYNEQISNLFTSFTRGLFNPTKDPYYRPLFLDMMILNFQVSGENVEGYHVLNVALHGLTVWLLYRLLLKLQFEKLQAFVLCLLFAVHPVLSQAVAWIPGRNDTLLAVFCVSFFIRCINYTNEGKRNDLVLSVLFLLLALFTKETAVFAAPAAFVLAMYLPGKKWNDKSNLIMYGTWAGCIAVWFLARSMATTHITTSLTIGEQVSDFIGRLPLIIQYIGKIMLPVNLSVFPIQQDTVIYWGIIATVSLAGLVFMAGKPNQRVLLSGLAIFLLFLVPALLVPRNLNEQTFEHRLYLPMMGMLLVLHETLPLKKLMGKQLLIGAVVICCIFGFINVNHQKSFADPLTFWRSAAISSPHSAYANMMYAARIPKDSIQKSYDLFRKAYQLNPGEKYLNFYYGVMLQMQDSVAQSEKYFKYEKEHSGYYECDFYLARIAITKGDTTGAINYLKTYVKADPRNPAANGNLLLMLMTRNDLEGAREQAMHMKMAGIPIPPEFAARLNIR